MTANVAIVCGSRDWRNRGRLFAVLNDLHAEKPFSLILEGEAGKELPTGKVICGADKFAREWAIAHDVPFKAFPVSKSDWALHGKSAGPRRNRLMLVSSWVDQVIGFHNDWQNSKGTRDMIKASLDLKAINVAVYSETELVFSRKPWGEYDTTNRTA